MSLFRKQAQILVTLFRTKGPVSGEQLAHNGGFSQKTLKKEIDEINASAAAENGFVILSKAGMGYEIEVSDPKRFHSFREQTIAGFYRFEFFRNSQADMVHYILRRLLTEDGVFLTQIAEDCYCSTSTVNRCMKAVRQRLDVYHLKIVNHTNSGLFIEGREWDIRLALVSEYQIYSTYRIEGPYAGPEKIDRLFLSGGEYRAMITGTVRRVLTEKNYYLPFEGVRKFVNLVILTFTRRRYKEGLWESEPQFRRNSYDEEAAVITRIFQSLPDANSLDVSEVEVLSLCSFLKAARLIRPADFEKRDDRNELAGDGEEFIRYLKSQYMIGEDDLAEFRPDFFCHLAMLKERLANDLHYSHTDVRPAMYDGLAGYDMCVELYWFLRDKGIGLTPYDAMSFYYLFTYILSSSQQSHPLRVLLISRYGYYYAKNLAEHCSRVAVQPKVEFVPAEYLMIEKLDLREYAAIATDIDEIRKNYSRYPTVQIFYFRYIPAILNMVQEIVLPRSFFCEKIFRPQDLLYISAETINDVYAYLEEQLLKEEPGRDEFMRILKEKNREFPPVRKNAYLVFNTVRDTLGKDYFKVLAVQGDLEVQNTRISLIFILNVHDRAMPHQRMYNRMIANVIQSRELIMGNDPKAAYEALVNVMLSYDQI
jgi:biotin operon repressor